MKKPRVKLTAVMSNESAYLPQWIHHHRYFGFDGFEIYYNRITDNSLEMLNKLASYYSDLKYQSIDWIDIYYNNSPPYSFLQYSTYLQDYYKSTGEYDYVMYLDMDEFWTPENSKDSIQDCILKFNNPNVIIFDWFYIGGESEYIMPLFSHKYLYGNSGPWTKFIIKTGLKPTGLLVHAPKFDNIDRVIVADGAKHKINYQSKNSLLPEQRKTSKQYFVVHDAMRTPYNNLSKIVRSAPATTKYLSSIEDLIAYRPVPYQMKFSYHLKIFENNIDSSYFKEFRHMCASLNILHAINQGRVSEILLALESLRIMEMYPDKEIVIKFTSSTGDLHKLHDELFMKLISYHYADSSLYKYSFKHPQDLVDKNNAIQINELIEASRLYPYAKDDKARPLYLCHALNLLLDNGEFAKARELIENNNLLVNRIFGSEWALPYFANAYTLHRQYGNALNEYEKMSYSYDVDIQKKINSLLHLISTAR